MLPKGSTRGSSPPSPTLTLNPYIPLNSLPPGSVLLNSPLRDRVRPVSASSDNLSSTSASPDKNPPPAAEPRSSLPPRLLVGRAIAPSLGLNSVFLQFLMDG